jgi:hypothetical protein
MPCRDRSTVDKRRPRDWNERLSNERPGRPQIGPRCGERALASARCRGPSRFRGERRPCGPRGRHRCTARVTECVEATRTPAVDPPEIAVGVDVRRKAAHVADIRLPPNQSAGKHRAAGRKRRQAEQPRDHDHHGERADRQATPPAAPLLAPRRPGQVRPQVAHARTSADSGRRGLAPARMILMARWTRYSLRRCAVAERGRAAGASSRDRERSSGSNASSGRAGRCGWTAPAGPSARTPAGTCARGGAWSPP